MVDLVGLCAGLFAGYLHLWKIVSTDLDREKQAFKMWGVALSLTKLKKSAA